MYTLQNNLKNTSTTSIPSTIAVQNGFPRISVEVVEVVEVSSETFEYREKQRQSGGEEEQGENDFKCAREPVSMNGTKGGSGEVLSKSTPRQHATKTKYHTDQKI